MATFVKRGSVWMARIRRKGFPSISETFKTKGEAVAWATATEAEILTGKRGSVPNKTFGDLVDRYLKEVTPKKRGAEKEALRLNNMLGIGKSKTADDLVGVRLPDLGPEHIGAWRDRRLSQVSEASVLREWATLSSVCNHAVKEWRWLDRNPMAEMKRPKPPAPRTQQFTDKVIDRLLLACGYDYQAAPETQMARVGAAMLFAIETAMRAGEICRLTWDRVDLVRRLAHLNELNPETGRYLTKNASARSVPLSSEALRILEQLKLVREEGQPVFRLEAELLDALFRKAKARALVEDLHFHDTRRTALTRMAKKVDVLMLAKISGHKDLRILQNVYYVPDMDDVGAQLD